MKTAPHDPKDGASPSTSVLVAERHFGHTGAAPKDTGGRQGSVFAASGVPEALRVPRINAGDIVAADVNRAPAESIFSVQRPQNYRDTEDHDHHRVRDRGDSRASRQTHSEYVSQTLHEGSPSARLRTGRSAPRRRRRPRQRRQPPGGLIGEYGSDGGRIRTNHQSWAAPATVLIHGESGTGEEGLIRPGQSLRLPFAPPAPSVPVNCGGTPSLGGRTLRPRTGERSPARSRSGAGLLPDRDRRNHFSGRDSGEDHPPCRSDFCASSRTGEVCMVRRQHSRKVDVDSRGNQPGPARARTKGRIPRGPFLASERPPHRSSSGSILLATLPRKAAADMGRAPLVLRTRRFRLSGATTGRETSANLKTWFSALPSCATGHSLMRFSLAPAIGFVVLG